jgi:hypothetical protein
MTTRVVFVAAVGALLFASASLAGCSSSSSSANPKNRLIVLGDSIAGISLSEPQKSVEKALGRGTSRGRGLVWYFGGRLLVDYWFHDQLTTQVEELETRWRGFHTRSGVHVGTSRQALRALHVTCRNGECWRAAGHLPDAPGTLFRMRQGKVAEIDIFYS